MSDCNKLSALRTVSLCFFCFVRFVACQGHFFRLNLSRKVPRRFSHTIFSSQAIILDFFDHDVVHVVFVFFGCFVEQGEVGSQILVLFDFAEILTWWSWIVKEIDFTVPTCGSYQRQRDVSRRSQGFEDIFLQSVGSAWSEIFVDLKRNKKYILKRSFHRRFKRIWIYICSSMNF